ncbi:MAG: ABC transporter permease [Lachnospiraceae bacterium]|nr:ABC transporter permease [Lachnospiraceae bacterium]
MKYVGKKIITLLFTLLFISMAAFLVFQIIPGDPAEMMLDMDATDAQIEAMREQLGLHRPLPIRYISWIVDFCRGNLGTSYNYQIPVAELLKDKLPVTFALAGITFVLILVLSVPFGLFQVRFAKKKIGTIMHVGNQIFMSIPSFFLGVLIILIFGLILKWFTPGNYISYTENIAGFLLYLIAPAMAIAVPKSAMVVKFLRNSVLEQEQSDYVRTAYSKGNTEQKVLYRHILKNALIPVVTILGMMAAETMAGSIVVEQVFNLPGLGRLLVSSIGSRDYPVVQAILVYIASVVVIMNGIVDVLYRYLDPRIRVE